MKHVFIAFIIYIIYSISSSWSCILAIYVCCIIDVNLDYYVQIMFYRGLESTDKGYYTIFWVRPFFISKLLPMLPILD